jgi:hypothetical protein
MGAPPGFVPRSGSGVQDLHEWAVMSGPDSSGSEVMDSFVTGTERLAGATPQTPRGAIPRGSTSSIAHGRKAVGRGVAAQRVQRMGRKVHLQRNRPEVDSAGAFPGSLGSLSSWSPKRPPHHLSVL